MDDITSPKDCLYGAFVYSTRALAYLKGVHFNSTSSSQKVIAYISAGDIPKEGQNIGLDIMNLTEVLFANSLTECAGQALGVVVHCYSSCVQIHFLDSAKSLLFLAFRLGGVFLYLPMSYC